MGGALQNLMEGLESILGGAWGKASKPPFGVKKYL